MNSIDFLELGGAAPGRPLMIWFEGNLWPLDDPCERNFQWVLTALYLRHLPSIPHNIPMWMHDLVFDRWVAAWQLPPFADARRLAYLVDHYRSEISHDLSVYTHYDLGDLWRSRRWTLLLDIIDRLPAHSWYAAAVSMDEDHAQMMAESIIARRANGDETDPKGPSLTTWTPEVAKLAEVLDAVRHVSWAVMAAQAGSKAGDPPPATMRPVTPLERALKKVEYDRRQAAHRSLVSRLIRPTPQAAPEQEEPPQSDPVRHPSPADVARVLARKNPVKG